MRFTPNNKNLNIEIVFNFLYSYLHECVVYYLIHYSFMSSMYMLIRFFIFFTIVISFWFTCNVMNGMPIIDLVCLVTRYFITFKQTKSKREKRLIIFFSIIFTHWFGDATIIDFLKSFTNQLEAQKVGKGDLDLHACANFLETKSFLLVMQLHNDYLKPNLY